MDAQGTVALVVLAVVVTLLAMFAVRAVLRRPVDRADLSREDLAAIAENQRVNGGRDHGQSPTVNRWADRGGWG